MGTGWSYYYWPGYYPYPYVHSYPVPYPYHPTYGSIKENEGVSDNYYDHLYNNYAEEEIIGKPVHDGFHVIDEDTFFHLANEAIPKAPTSELRSWRKSAEKHYQRLKENGDHELAVHIKDLSTHISEELLERKSTEDPTHPDYSDDEEEDIDAEMEHYDSSVFTNHYAAEKDALKRRNADNLEILKSLAEASDIHELQENHKVASHPWKRMHIYLFGKGKKFGDGKKMVKVTVKTVHAVTYHDDYTKVMEMHDTLTFQYVVTAYLREFFARAAKNTDHVSLMEYHKDQKNFSECIANALKLQAVDFTVGMIYHICFHLRNVETSSVLEEPLIMLEEYVNYVVGQFEKIMSEHIDLERAYIENSVIANIGPESGKDDAKARIEETRESLDSSSMKMATLFANVFGGGFQELDQSGKTVTRRELAPNIRIRKKELDLSGLKDWGLSVVYPMILRNWKKHVSTTLAYTDLLTSKGFTQTISESDKALLNYLESGQELGKYLNALAYKLQGDPLSKGKAIRYIAETMNLAKEAPKPVVRKLPPSIPPPRGRTTPPTLPTLPPRERGDSPRYTSFFDAEEKYQNALAAYKKETLGYGYHPRRGGYDYRGHGMGY